MLNCNINGGYDDTSELKFTDIQLAEGGPRYGQNYQVGYAPAKNGTFNVLLYGVNGWVTYRNRELGGVTVTLITPDSAVVPRITTTNKTGYYNFANVEVGDYYLYFSKQYFEDNYAKLTVQSGETKVENVSLWKKSY